MRKFESTTEESSSPVVGKPHPDAVANVSYYNRTIKDWNFDLADPSIPDNVVTLRIHDSVIDHLPLPYVKDKWGYEIKTTHTVREHICLQISFRLNGERKGYNISFHQPNISFIQELDRALYNLKNLEKATTQKTYYYHGK